jgi:hypothetical protein
MIKKNAKSWGIIPLLFIVFCNMLTYYLFKGVCRELATISPMEESTYSLFKFVVAPGFNIFLAGILLFAAKKISVYQIVQRTYLITAIFVSIFLFIIVPWTINSFDGTSTSTVSSFLGDVRENWVHALFYLLSGVWAPLTLLLFYGYFNNIITFSRACRLYPTLSIFSLLMLEFLMPDLNQMIFFGSIQEKIFKTGVISIICLLTTVYCFYRTNLNAKDEKGDHKSSFGWMFILSLIFLTITVGFTKNISIITWDFSILLKDSFPDTYWEFLDGFSALKNLSIFLAVIILGFLSVYLKQNKIDGWKHFYYLSTGIITLLMVTIIFLNIMSTSIGSYLVKGDTSLFDKLLTSVGGSYQIFITTIFYPTLLCLKQLMFVPVPFQDRFRSKVIIDLVFHKAGYFVVVLIQGGLLPFSDFKLQIMLILGFSFFVMLIIRILCINYVSKKLELAA